MLYNYLTLLLLFDASYFLLTIPIYQIQRINYGNII